MKKRKKPVSSPPQPPIDNPQHRAIAEKIITKLKEPPDGVDVLFCRPEDGFSLDVLTETEEQCFRAALAATSIQVVSFPISDPKGHFADLFGNGKKIITCFERDHIRRDMRTFIPTSLSGPWLKDDKDKKDKHKKDKNVLVI
ncbi:MAG: hypothetical protein A3E38_01370 [Candidatus Moranbacteria bacterium RIFCSPHIGHO2_12_FULL_54_9]|nr:MAG: hypothetical protein A2878_00530 [Candidatus Moranbacteria bacterium RIFCSPHIGHO2_01_FULL_54_31]OGI24888.1 MAG: hypothetical protein A3E38_01370 [Candidatus Moranbacteria bacterium RIFCSPHIGHO2_12_FULL_54_9]